MQLFLPKHQKLILQCYPPGRSPDKKPNSSELSYLLYYASTRRVKLVKVGRFLEKKNSSDIAHNRTGNVQVTLEILHALIKKCPDDISVFADNINAVFSTVLSSGDLGLCQHALPVFASYCALLDGELFAGDPLFRAAFSKLAHSFVELSSLAAAGSRSTDTSSSTAIALQAAAAVATCKCIPQGSDTELVEFTIPFVVKQIASHFSLQKLEARTKSLASENDLSKYNTIKSGTEKDPNPTLSELSIQTLKAFFSTSSSTQLTVCTRTISSFLSAENIDNKWAATLIEMVTNWVPVQLRFIVLSILTSQLQKDTKSSDQLLYLSAISNLLSSSVNLVGLSVIDNLRLLIRLQTRLITESTSAEASRELIYAYSGAIGSLATHTYYQDQILDMVGELLVRINEIFLAITHVTKLKYSAESYKNLLLMLLDNIKNVLITANANTTVQRSNVPFEVFSSTLGLLSFHHPSVFSSGDLFKIHSKYSDILIAELRLEYSKSQEFLKPDHNSLITNAKTSIINQFYEQVELISKIEGYSNSASIVLLIEMLIDIFGTNAIVNGFPFFFEWQLKDYNEKDFSMIMRDNYGYVITYFAVKSLDNQEFLDKVLARIDFRKQHSLWIIKSDLPIAQGTSKPEFQLTKDEVASLLQQSLIITDYTDTIINSHYRYLNDSLDNAKDPSKDQDPDASMLSSNTNYNHSLANFVPSNKFLNCENNSIKSAPLSARSLLNSKLHAPKIQELRQAVSGSGLAKSGFFSSNASQKTDVGSLLRDLTLDTAFNEKGALTFTT